MGTYKSPNSEAAWQVSEQHILSLVEKIIEYVVCTTPCPSESEENTHPSETVEKMEVSYNHGGSILLGGHFTTYGRETL